MTFFKPKQLPPDSLDGYFAVDDIVCVDAEGNTFEQYDLIQIVFPSRIIPSDLSSVHFGCNGRSTVLQTDDYIKSTISVVRGIRPRLATDRGLLSLTTESLEGALSEPAEGGDVSLANEDGREISLADNEGGDLSIARNEE